MTNPILVRQAESRDAEELSKIYNYYVQNSVATFEETEVEPELMWRRILDVKTQALPWLVATQDNAVLGYAYASNWKARSAYRFCAEVTVYLAKEAQSMGVGTCLYSQLFKKLKDSHIEVVIACLSLPNEASVALHEKFGMEKVGHFNDVGFKFDHWVDIGYWQLNLASKSQGERFFMAPEPKQLL